MTNLETSFVAAADKHLVAAQTLDIRTEQLQAAILSVLANSNLLKMHYGTGKLMGGKLDMLDCNRLRTEFTMPYGNGGETMRLSEIERDGTLHFHGEKEYVASLDAEALQRFATEFHKMLKYLTLQMEIG